MATLPMTQDMEGVEDTKLERNFSTLESNCENTVEKKRKKEKKEKTQRKNTRSELYYAC